MTGGLLPEVTTPRELAEHLGWSERRVRDKARELGACRILGNRMVLLPQDIKAILEVTKPCRSKSISVASWGVGELPPMTTPRDAIADWSIRIYGTLCMTFGLVMGFWLARMWS